MKMRHLLYSLALISSLFLWGCKGDAGLDYAKAKKVCETCLQYADKQNISGITDECYATDLSAASKEGLQEKFSRLKESTGDLNAFTVKDSSMTTEIGEEANIKLTYEVKHSKLITTQIFTVTEQNGQYKISGHFISN